MMMNRGQVSAEVSRIATEEAAKAGFTLSDEALELIATPSPDFQVTEIDVDRSLLAEAIKAVIIKVVALHQNPNSGRQLDVAKQARVTADTIELALAASNCHYLWFC